MGIIPANLNPVEFLTDPQGQQVPYDEVVWTAGDQTLISVPDWPATAVRRAERENLLEHLYLVFYDELHLCGCGQPSTAWELIHQILLLAPFFADLRWRQVEELCGTSGAHHIVLSALTHAGLIEHGGGIGGSWITDKGRWFVWAVDQAGGVDGLDEQMDTIGLPHNRAACTASCWTVPANDVRDGE